MTRSHVPLRSLLALVLALLAVSTTSRGDPRPPAFSTHGIHVTPPRVAHGPVVDGRLDDAVWTQAAVLDSYTQGRPIEDVPDSLGTRCLVIYDEKQLYFGFHCRDRRDGIQSPILPRDNVWQGDYVCVSLDTWYDHQRSQFFCANASGVQMDGVDRDGVDSDLAPDFLYTSKGRLTEDGWELEMAIPFTSLRFPSRGPVTFGINLERQIKREDAAVYWARITRNINSYHAQMGSLEGLAGVRPGMNLKVNPTFTNVAAGERATEGIVYDNDPRFGLGVKYGLTSGLTGDVAITPDFSQIEADASVIDINQRFAIFYPEKRPFFLEGSEIFELPINLIYTRRIVDPLYGVKLTGKAARTSVGVINASDRSSGESIPGLPDPANPYLGHDAQFAIARLRTDVLANSNVGVMAGFKEDDDAYNRVGGADTRINFTDQYSLIAQGAVSTTRERDYTSVPAALPPGQMVNVDSTLLAQDGATHDGYAGTLELRRDSKHLDVSLSTLDVSPDFRAEMGFVNRPDQITYHGEITPKLTGEETSWFTLIAPDLEYERIYDHEGPGYLGRFTDELIRPSLEIRIPKGTRFGVAYSRVFTWFEGTSFPDQDRGEAWFGSDRFEAVRPSVTFTAGENVIFEESIPGRFWAITGSAALRFTRQFDGEFSFNAESDTRAETNKLYGQIVIPRLKLNYQFTKELALRQIVELRKTRFFDTDGLLGSVSRTLSLDWLASYYVRPGTVVYVGYGTVLEGSSFESLRPGRSNAFVKLSYLWEG